MSVGGPIQGIGSRSSWGHSPAMDLLKFAFENESLETQTEKQVFHILIVGQADMRHVLETLARNWKNLEEGKIFIHFYIAEDSVEVIGREMLLLSLAVEQNSWIGLEEKTIEFMELFGNILIRPKTQITLLEQADKLIGIANLDDKSSIFNLSDLKYRDRDDLVEFFRQCRLLPNPSKVSWKEAWRKRIEKYLGVRYDVRANVFDWDYSMHLKTKGPSVISMSEYKNWRETGIGFAQYDADYSQPNPTLITDFEIKGNVTQGYLGEIVTGPFIPFSLEADDPSLFKEENGRNTSTANDVTKYNIQRICRTFQTSTKPLHELFQIHILSPSSFATPKFFTKFKDIQFDVACFSVLSAQYILPPIINLLRPTAPVILENPMYLLAVRTECREMFRDKVMELGRLSGLDFELEKCNGSIYQFKKNELEKIEEATGGDVTNSTAVEKYPATKIIEEASSASSDCNLG